ncbi:MAG: acyl-CoA dehydrogenase family protein [Burkholderiales bacterium]|nr:acyl-CoA dehydrogenase family protein [Burkholderiales bacterium]
MDYQPRPDEVAALVLEVAGLRGALAGIDAVTAADDALVRQVLEEAGRFVAARIAPLSRSGDEVGARFEDGRVTMPPGFRDAYRAFWQGGWPALSARPEDGGQGLPTVLECVLYEWLTAANHGWTMAPGLLHGAYECLRHHASDEVKARYLQKVATGEWLATMCLTEPHAGSDLGLVRTRAVPQADGSYRISGTKIFISNGEHDLTDNIVHLVLARLPDAPPGPKGLSLFVTAKFLPDGARSAVHCERIEEKMGLHASPTCVMRFDEACAWMVGAPGRGLGAMFVMMNSARLHVALQGIGLLDAAWQKADAYARERRQMRAPGPRAAGAPPGAAAADPIIAHPAVRRLLDTQRAWVDGARVLAYRTGLELDLARHHGAPERRAAAERWCAFITPVLKAACTEQAFVGASDCLQVFGGHGYVREWGIEQIVRDARVAMIYEGTNEIQAIDLLVRKTLPDGGAGLAAFFADLGAAGADAARFGTLVRLAAAIGRAAPGQAELPYRIAGDFLRATALALLGWAWSRIGATAGFGGARWDAPRRALADWILPEFAMRTAIIETQLAQAGAPPNPP